MIFSPILLCQLELKSIMDLLSISTGADSTSIIRNHCLQEAKVYCFPNISCCLCSFNKFYNLNFGIESRI